MENTLYIYHTHKINICGHVALTRYDVCKYTCYGPSCTFECHDQDTSQYDQWTVPDSASVPSLPL